MIISSKSNPLIKNTKKLLRKKYRKESYLIEGWHLFQEALNAKQTFVHIFVLEELADRLNDLGPVILVTPEVLKELTDSPTPQGIIAEVEMPSQTINPKPMEKILLLEDIQDPGNLGTIIRTADAANMDAVILSEKCADIYNQKTLRSMQGSHFHIPIIRTDVYDYCERLKEFSFPILASTLSAESKNYHSFAHLEKFVLVMGNEGQGISEQMTHLASDFIHIAMPGQAESLNVAVAAGILIFSLI
ncbi:TrmH family RNA methyltransferase [Streptococcus catagoni]|uniref:TrmH family RNA methyltransferase n=1 Tax=Streptococcus catagoni TaxID=2654874 RepID=UPI001408297C|nr:RNA methyltransferase [Streptococcus catagoni]